MSVLISKWTPKIDEILYIFFSWNNVENVNKNIANTQRDRDVFLQLNIFKLENHMFGRVFISNWTYCLNIVGYFRSFFCWKNIVLWISKVVYLIPDWWITKRPDKYRSFKYIFNWWIFHPMFIFSLRMCVYVFFLSVALSINSSAAISMVNRIACLI